MTKLTKTVVAESLSRYDFDGETLAEIRDKVAMWIDAHGADAKLDLYVYSDDLDISIEVKVEETDAEHERRLERESATKAAADAKELALFKQLQAKYGQN